jgi:hypothetical protein
MPRRFHVVYMIKNLLDGKRYIGKTSGKNKFAAVQLRWARHLSMARLGNGFLLHRAIRKHGAECFSIYPIEVFRTEGAAFSSEKRWILRVSPAYNLSAGGQGTKSGHYIRKRYRASEVKLKEARASNDKFYNTGEPCKNGHLAPRYTSTRQCSECNHLRFLATQGGVLKGPYRGTRSPEFKAKVSAAMKGKPKTEDHARNISLGRLRAAQLRKGVENHV